VAVGIVATGRRGQVRLALFAWCARRFNPLRHWKTRLVITDEWMDGRGICYVVRNVISSPPDSAIGVPWRPHRLPIRTVWGNVGGGRYRDWSIGDRRRAIAVATRTSSSYMCARAIPMCPAPRQADRIMMNANETACSERVKKGVPDRRSFAGVYRDPGQKRTRPWQWRPSASSREPQDRGR